MEPRESFARFAEWWHQPDRYDWLISFVEARGYGFITRMGIAGACLAIGLWPILMALSPLGVTGVWVKSVSVGLGVVVSCSAVWFASHWPTARQSRFIVTVFSASIAANCALYISQGRPLVYSIGLAVTAGYVACVHTPKYLVALLATATSLIGASLVCNALTGSVAAALADGALRFATVTVVPLTIQMLVQLLGDNAVVSDIDPLTNLANRRGLDLAVRQLLGSCTADLIPMSVTMIDIDAFKTINDTHGHATGDRVLVALGQILRRRCGNDSVLARVGGEEFVIIKLSVLADAERVAQQLRTELSATPWALTASFGIATTTLRRNAAVDATTVTADLMHAADDAMYTAKRAGGDRIDVACVPES